MPKVPVVPVVPGILAKSAVPEFACVRGVTYIPVVTTVTVVPATKQ
jgi:hypothetical protein